MTPVEITPVEITRGDSPIVLGLPHTGTDLPEGIRRRDTATERFWFNHSRAGAVVDGLDLPPLSVTRQLL